MSTGVSNPTPPPVSAPSASPASPAASASKRRWLWLGGGVALLGIGAVVWHVRGSSDSQASAPAEAPDTPRVEGERITFSRGFAERAKLKFSPVNRALLVPVVNAVGTVAFNPEHVAAVGTRLKGLVSRVTKFEGDTVESGAVLAIIESAELGEAQAAVSMLEAEKRAADVNLQREKTLSQKNLTTQREAEVASVEAERYQLLLGAARQKVAALSGGVGSRPGKLGSHELRSPLKGTIVERNIAPGQSVEGQLVAFRIADLDHLWVELDVFERNLSKIRVGDRVELSPLAAQSEIFEGRVARVGAVIDLETRSAPIRVEVDNRDRRLRAGQAVNARIHAASAGEHQSTLVPSSAITFVDGKSTVFVKSGENAVRVVKLELGTTNGHETEAISGVNPGDEVVSEGVFALKSELFR
ncbi:MAG TPA: efflux RND transporter periplasmic adaptor subunit [Polyangiaceae bacterium]|nr:efflux RND transporter periplasmic adaptor subunit [Polyangiaceae bacterium]